MTHTEHTPTPWTVGGSAHDWHRIHRKVGEYCGPVVAKCYGTRGERNPDAEHIVRAVNSHDALKGVVRTLIERWESIPEDQLVPEELNDTDEWNWDIARAALALAEGETT